MLSVISALMTCLLLCMAVPTSPTVAATSGEECLHHSLDLISIGIPSYPYADNLYHQKVVSKHYRCNDCGADILTTERVNEPHSINSETHQCECGFTLR